MINKELYDFIIKGHIEKSLYSTCIFLIKNSKMEILEETLIAICSYIGTFITLKDIIKLNDIIITLDKIINTEKLNISEYLIIVTKMCILCNIHNSHPLTKTGIMPVAKLREKILDVFSEEDKLSSNGILKFEQIIPPVDSEAYLLSIKIITAFVRIIKILDGLSSEQTDNIELLSNKFKNCFDYIIRKKYIIETKLNPNEHDPIYFLWGFVEILYSHEEFIHKYYTLFSHNYTKKLKKDRIGLLYAVTISIVYSYKRFISSSWNQNELMVVNKTKEISHNLLKQVKSDLKQLNINHNSTSASDSDNDIDNKKVDGLTFIWDYLPKCNTNKQTQEPIQFNEEIIHISI